MVKRLAKRSMALIVLVGLGGCVYAPYPGYYGYPGYPSGYVAAPVAGVVVGGGYGYYRRPYYWR